MKKLLFTSAFFALLLSLYGCMDYPEMNPEVRNTGEPVFEGRTVESGKTATTITVKANITKGNGVKITERGFYYGEKSPPSEENGGIKLPVNGTEIGEYTLTIEGLTNNTTYYIRPYAINANGAVTYGPVISIVTTVGRPVVETLIPEVIYASSAIVRGKIRSEGEEKIDTLGFYVYAKDNITKIDTFYFDTNYSVRKPEEVEFAYRLPNTLKPATWYYVQAFATNIYGKTVGDCDSLLTKNGIPVIIDNKTSIKNTSFTDAELTSSATNGGDETVIIAKRGFCWSSNATVPPTLSNDTVLCGSGAGDFEGTIPDLLPNVTYYVRAYVISNWDIVVYSDTILRVRTLTDIPTVETGRAEHIISGGADVGGIIKSEGMSTVTDFGICWSTTNPVPGLTDSILPLTVTAEGVVSTGRLTQLKGGTTYYIRAYATSNKGTGYGDVEQFQTPPIFVTSGLTPFDGGARVNNNTLAYFAVGDYLYLLGGDVGPSYTDELRRYSIDFNNWQQRTSFVDGPMKWQSAVTFGGGAFVYGGNNGNNTEKPGIYYYNVALNLWDYKDGPDTIIVNRTIGYAYDQSVTYVGGVSDDTLREDVWRYTPSLNTWQRMTDFPEKQYGGVAVVINDIAYVGMGIDTNNVCNGSLWSTTDDAATWDPQTTYSDLVGNVLGGVVCNKRLFIIDESYHLIEYNPETDVWTKKSRLPQYRRAFHCIYSVSNKIYIGLGENLSSGQITIYDPSWDND